MDDFFFFSWKVKHVWLKAKLETENYSSETFSRKTRKGYRNSFQLLLIDDGWMWTSLLPSYQLGWPLLVRPADCLRLPRATPAMPFSVAATFGYKPAHNIACNMQPQCELLDSDLVEYVYSTLGDIRFSRLATGREKKKRRHNAQEI